MANFGYQRRKAKALRRLLWPQRCSFSTHLLWPDHFPFSFGMFFFYAAESESWQLKQLNVYNVTFISRYSKRKPTLKAKRQVPASTRLQIREERCSSAEVTKGKSYLFWWLCGWEKWQTGSFSFPAEQEGLTKWVPDFKRTQVIVCMFARDHRFHLREEKEPGICV